MAKPEVCDACKGISDMLERVYKEECPKTWRGLAREEFEELMDGKPCLENLVCLPMLRLNLHEQGT